MTKREAPGEKDEGKRGATVVFYENGPLLLRGDFTLRTPDGAVIDPGRGTVALCRCGKSARKPFCDGTHKAVNFRASAGRDVAAPRDAA
ncbi:CDGSH iron-sulfur domain-containing protein [Actinoplanes sp. NPDC049118]|uniref:CDGSH iron-sulfur domain-containing protein n=1 Tax=Actinoplanes sp. NPDC049118 TaxID=3155769 RepID=UPI0033D4C759